MLERIVLDVHGVGVAFAASSPIIRDAEFRLVPGWYGLVGANAPASPPSCACSPVSSRRWREPSGASPGTPASFLCPQEVDGLTEDVRSFANDDGGLAFELRGRLVLLEGEIERWPTLSPGERKRWQIGAALAREPDILLLDEPTNHLDAAGRRLLVGALGRFRGIGVVVSHDRALLDELPRADDTRA